MDTKSDIYTRLKSDHASVADMLQRLMKTDATRTGQRPTLFTELKHSLTKHSEAEKEVFYAALLPHSETRDLIHDGQEEHQRIETLLNELGQMDTSAALWGARLQALKGIVEHHVREEEEKVFPKARKILTVQRAEELGRQFEQAKARHTPATVQATTASYTPEVTAKAPQPGERTTAQATTASYTPEVTAKAPQPGERISHEAQRLADAAKERGRSLLNDQQQFFASQIGGVAEALHRTAQQLGEEDQKGISQYVNQAAAGLERFSHTLRDRDLSSLVSQVEGFARQQPVAFIGSAAFLGFLAARFLKSSAERRHPAYHPSSPPTEGIKPYTDTMAPSPAYGSTVGTPGSETPATMPVYGAPVGASDPQKRGTT